MSEASDDPPRLYGDQRLTLLHSAADAAYIQKQVLPHLSGRDLEVRPYVSGTELGLEVGACVVTCLDDDALSSLLGEAARRDYWLGVLPHRGLRHGAAMLGVPAEMAEAMEDLLGCERALPLDVFSCNGQPVLSSVVIGEVSQVLTDAPRGIFTGLRRLKDLWSTLRSTPLQMLGLETKAGHKLETAVLGIVAVDHGGSSFLSRKVLQQTDRRDGMLHALLVSPRSVMDVLGYLARASSPFWKQAALPPFVGHVASTELCLKSPRPIPYTQDGTVRTASDIQLSIAPRALRLAPGRAVRIEPSNAGSKETFQVKALPTGEACSELASRPLPLRTHAATEEFKELFVVLREGARSSPTYLTLMVLSTLLAALGLFASSGPVIIGAMILAPLMAPIISLAMGTLREDETLMLQSAKTLLVGVLLALGCASLLTLMLPLRTLTPEIAARLNPTLLDLGVAVTSGVAGAYAHARAELARSLAGVAIAVALVPPLAVVGIGLAWGDVSVFRGSSLLFLTNLAGIVLAAALTFLVLGFSPFRRARRGLLVSLASVATVSIPLALGFSAMADERHIVHTLEGWEVQGATLRHVDVRRGDPTHLSLQLVSSKPMDVSQIDGVKRSIEERIGREVRLEATVAVVR